MIASVEKGLQFELPVLRRPGGELASRPLHFYFLVDCSGSMALDGKIQALNNAAREALPHMREVARGNPHAKPLLRVLRFATGAEWMTAEPVPIERFSWSELSAGGVTDLGAALGLLVRELGSPEMPRRALPPVIVLISDGRPTDDFDAGLAALDAEPWGAQAVRLGIAIGRDADHEMLSRFIGDPLVPILQANAPEALVRQIRWASTIGLASSSSPTISGSSLEGGGLAAAGWAGGAYESDDDRRDEPVVAPVAVPPYPAKSHLSGVSAEGLRLATASSATSPGVDEPGGVISGTREDELEVW